MLKVTSELLELQSVNLQQPFIIEIFYPPGFGVNKSYPLFILNDGQEMANLELGRILSDVYKYKVCKDLIVATVYASDRLHTYGVAGHLDYKKRGSKAGLYSKFIIEEFLPFLLKQTALPSFTEYAIGGFSLGGLSAFDIAWNHSEVFSKVMACSASFWWRSKDLDAGYTEKDRIMHEVVRNTKTKPSHSIWLQAGTLDEKEDRNNNGIIDSIDDMLDMVAELKAIGYQEKVDLVHHEVIGGRHTMETYGMVLPYFLHWAWPKAN
jgi:enterochelin esterase-like enzyme